MHLSPRSFLAIAVFALSTLSTLSAADLPEAGKNTAVAAEEEDRLCFSSPFLKVAFAANRPNFGFLGVDSLGKGKVDQNIMSKEMMPPVVYQTTRSKTADQLTIAYIRDMAASRAEWELTATQKTLRFVSHWLAGAPAGPRWYKIGHEARHLDFSRAHRALIAGNRRLPRSCPQRPLEACRSTFATRTIQATFFGVPSESTLRRSRTFALDATTPSQSPRAEPFLDLVGHGVHATLLPPFLAVEEHALDLACVVQAADSHAEEPHG